MKVPLAGSNAAGGVTETLLDVEIDAVADGDGDVDREMEEEAVPDIAP